MRKKALVVFSFLVLGMGGGSASEVDFKNQSRPFSRESLMENSSLSLTNPSRFSMQQSYSTTMSYSGAGSLSYGLYLNRLSYQLASPLSLSMDVGFMTPFHGSGYYSGFAESGQPAGQFVIPRVGLDYRPTENTHLSLQLMNLNAFIPGMSPYPGYHSYP